MIAQLITKKNNALTDGNLPDRKVLTQKLLNVLNKKYEDEGTEFKVAINELATMLNMTVNSGKTKLMIYESLSILQQPIQLRNFDYKGRGIKWISAPYLSEATIYGDDKNYVNIQLNDKIIEGLKQKEQYTVIDINISNKFRTKYGIVIWEMYLRYKNQNRSGVAKDWTFQTFSLKELNKKFGTNYKYNSDMLKCIERGLKEIKKITDKDIKVQFQKDKKEFGFFWEKEKQIPKYLKSEKNFIAYIREKYIANVQENIYPTIHKNDDGTEIKVNFKGYLYAIKDKKSIDFDKNQAQKIWTQLYKMAKNGREF